MMSDQGMEIKDNAYLNKINLTPFTIISEQQLMSLLKIANRSFLFLFRLLNIFPCEVVASAKKENPST